MFLHSFKYFIKVMLRDKESLFWVMLFPILLGTLFKVSFSGLAESEELNPIPVAVVTEESDTAEDLTDVLVELEKEENDALLIVTRADEAKAKELLSNKEVDGIVYAGDKLKLTISAQMTDSDAKLSQSILESIVEQVNMKADLLTNILAEHPEKMAEAADLLEKEAEYVTEQSFTNGNTDFSIQYFTNLIAMACLFTSFTGVDLVIRNQANLSAIGARKNVSPVHKLVSVTVELLANVLLQAVVIMITIFYLVYILKIDFGVSLPMMLLTEFIGCLLGVAAGFFVGSIGKATREVKNSLCTGVSIVLCFLSGLMLGNMRMIVEGFCPIINKINPAALISDSFYALNVYDTYERYTQNIVTMVVMSVCFCIGGFLLVRRQKYASL